MLARLLSVLLTILLCVCSVQTRATDPTGAIDTGTVSQQKQVFAAAKSVAKMFNSGEYAESWKLLAPLLQAKTTQQEWGKYVSALRTPLGAPGASKVQGFGFTKTMADAPPGQYGIIGLETDFANIKGVQEKFVFQYEDKKWKLVGYWLSKKFTIGTSHAPNSAFEADGYAAAQLQR